MKKYFKKIVILISLLFILALPYIVLAESSSLGNLKTVGEKGNDAPFVATTDMTVSFIVGKVIQAFLGLLGVIFLSYLLFAGYAWMTAQGDEEKVTKAKDTIQRAIIGLIVTVGAYAISFWVLDKLVFNSASPILR